MYNCDALLGNHLQQVENGKEVVDYPPSPHSDSQCSDLDNVDDDSDDAFLSDGSETVQSHEDQKKSKCFRDFFQDLESMSEIQISEHDRQWHCPACKGGPGAIDWFRGLGPLATHARTMRSRRVKLHRTFADVLEEELRLRRTGASSGGMQGQSTFGKWKGIHDDNDVASVQMIVWPPIIVIQNTQLEQDEQGKVHTHAFRSNYIPHSRRITSLVCAAPALCIYAYELISHAISTSPNMPLLIPVCFGTLEWQLHQCPCALTISKFQNVA